MNSFLKGLGHGAISFVLFLVPVLFGIHNGWQDITLGAILNAIYHWAVDYNTT